MSPTSPKFMVGVLTSSPVVYLGNGLSESRKPSVGERLNRSHGQTLTRYDWGHCQKIYARDKSTQRKGCEDPGDTGRMRLSARHGERPVEGTADLQLQHLDLEFAVLEL